MRAAALVLPLLVAPVALAATGGAPVVLTQSGYLLDATDQPVTSGSMPFVFSIFASSSASGGEVPEWTASCALPVESGYFAATLGTGACVGASALETSDVPPGEARWLEITVGTTTLAPRERLAMLPTAALAADANRLGGLDASAYVTKAELGATGAGAIDAARITTGTLGSGRLSGTYPNALVLSNAANAISGNGAGLSNVTASGLAAGTYANAVTLSNVANVYYGDGSHLTGIPVPTGQASTITTDTSGGTSCTTAGAVRWTGAHFQGCNGTGWVQLDPVNNTSIVTLSSPTGATRGNYTLSLTGTGFQAGATVSVGGVAATGVSISGGGTSISFTVPPSASEGARNVVVTNPDGTGATSAGAFTYVASGETSALAVTTCKSLLNAPGPTYANTSYWINPTGSAAFQAFCDMTNNSGGWTRCLATKYWGASKPAGFVKATWLSGTFSTGSSWVFDNVSTGTNFGNFCTQIVAAGATQIVGEATYPSNWSATVTTPPIALPAGFFAAGSQARATGSGNVAIGVDSATQGRYNLGCGTIYTSNTNQGIQSLCISDATHYQAMHTGWLSGQYPGSCADSSAQPCYCSPNGYCGGTDTRENQIITTLYLK